MTTTVLCPTCEAEHEVDVMVSSPGCGATRWSPAESPEFDVVGLGVCTCGYDMDQSAQWSEAIDRALHAAAEMDVSSRGYDWTYRRGA
jgi:hypothetical protein